MHNLGKIYSRIFVITLALLVPASVVANKAIVPLAIIAAILGFLISWSRQQNLKPYSSILIVLCLLIVWALSSSLWSPDMLGSVQVAIKGALHIVFGIGLIRGILKLADSHNRFYETAIKMGYLTGLALLSVGAAYAYVTGDALWGHYSRDPLTTLNNGSVFMVLMSWPVYRIFWVNNRKIPGILVLLVPLLFINLSSSSSILAWIIGITTLVGVTLLGRKFVLGLATILGILFTISPALIHNLPKFEEQTSFSQYLPSLTTHRIAIWQYVTGKIYEKPLLGRGIDASRALSREAGHYKGELELLPLHPHNASLQIWLELGAPGAILSGILIFLIFFSIANNNQQRPIMAIQAAAAMSYLTIGAISYGVWQNWWLASAWVLTALLITGRPESETVTE